MMSPESPSPIVNPEFAEIQPQCRVELLTECNDETAAGIARLMPQLDEHFPNDPAATKAKVERIIASPDRGQLVAFNETNQVVGSASMNTLLGAGKDAEGWLEDFIVDADARGSGVADQMWQGMIGWCRSQGLSQFSFGTETWRPQAISFYQRMGADMDETSRHLTISF